MISYSLPLLFLVLLTFLEQNNNYKIILKNKYFYFLIFILFFIFIGFRDQIGCDWNAYETRFNIIKSQNIDNFFQAKDFLRTNHGFVFALFAKLLSYKFNFNALILFYSILFTVPLFIFNYSLKNTYLSLTVSYPYYIIVIGMGPLRQSAAISLVMFSILLASKSKYNLLFFNAIISFLTHYTSILVNSIIFFASNISSEWKLDQKIKYILLFLAIIVFSLNFSYIYESSKWYITLINTPAMNEAKSALILWIMNFLPTITYILNVNKFNFKSELKNIFFSLAIFEFFLLVIIPFNSVVAYRFILYSFPLSIYITSYIPEANIIKFKKDTIIYGISFLSFISLLTWLKLADHSYCWLPYKNIIFN